MFGPKMMKGFFGWGRGHGFDPRRGRMFEKGDLKYVILDLLKDKPSHGYEVIRALEERFRGFYSPSPGSVYPTLQLLADEGLISAEESQGRKTYSLTEAGRAEAEASGARPSPWQTSSPRESGGMGSLPKAGIELAQAAAQVQRTGTPEQVKQAVEVLEDARRRLYSILAQD